MESNSIMVRPYTASDQPIWDGFVRTARNGCFMFERNYMDYHAHRFSDASMMVFDGGKLCSVLPAHDHQIDGEQVLSSHGGLTFGGLVVGASAGAGDQLRYIRAVCDTARAAGFSRLTYRTMPHFMHREPSEDDVYALFQAGARPIRIDLAHTLDLTRRPALSAKRRNCIAKARKAGVEVRRSTDFESYWGIVESVLDTRHARKPTHSLDEIRLLASRFEQIQLVAAVVPSGAGEEIIAGAVTYQFDRVLHVQYLANSDRGRAVCALDAVIASLIEQAAEYSQWFSLGVSTEQEGRVLNEGLSWQKESFGARPTALTTWSLALN
ncbi:hypothetical protein IP84_17160 [beta proteobacterium AAP99]|nr:hypothetical protein IP84_17160 [beta proteobacterium AAP99]